MSNQDHILAELAAAKATLGPTAKARTARGKSVKAATSARRLQQTGRDAVFSVRCRADIPAAVKKYCAANEIKISEWFEALIDRELGAKS